MILPITSSTCARLLVEIVVETAGGGEEHFTNFLKTAGAVRRPMSLPR